MSTIDGGGWIVRSHLKSRNSYPSIAQKYFNGSDPTSVLFLCMCLPACVCLWVGVLTVILQDVSYTYLAHSPSTLRSQWFWHDGWWSLHWPLRISILMTSTLSVLARVHTIAHFIYLAGWYACYSTCWNGVAHWCCALAWGCVLQCLSMLWQFEKQCRWNMASFYPTFACQSCNLQTTCSTVLSTVPYLGDVTCTCYMIFMCVHNMWHRATCVHCAFMELGNFNARSCCRSSCPKPFTLETPSKATQATWFIKWFSSVCICQLYVCRYALFGQ